MRRIITGGIHGAHNKYALDWCYGDYIAFGCQTFVVIIDGISANQIQTLVGHKNNVCKVRWPSESMPLDEKSPVTRQLRLASCDLGGHIIVWDVVAGSKIASFSDQSCSFVAEMFWLTWADAGCCDFLLALHWPSSNPEKGTISSHQQNPACFTLWNAQLGTKIWQLPFVNTPERSWPFTFALDPFHPNNAAYLTRGAGHLTLIDDLSFSKPPSLENCRQFAVSCSDSNRTPENRHQTPPSTSFASTIVKTPIIKAIAAAADRSSWLLENGVVHEISLSSLASNNSFYDAEDNVIPSFRRAPFDESFLQLLYHKSIRNTLIIVHSRSVLFLDPTDEARVLSQIVFDRTASPISQLLSCSMRNAFYIAQENGIISLRTLKVKPVTSSSSELNDTYEAELVYELACSTEGFRVSKSCQVAGLTVRPSTEMHLCLLLSNGKTIFYDLNASNALAEHNEDISSKIFSTNLTTFVQRDEKTKQKLSRKVKLSVRAMTTPLGQRPTALRLCPEPAGPGRQHAAVGTFDGSVQIIDINSGDVERHFCVHACAVNCIEWVGASKLVSSASTKLPSAAGPVSNSSNASLSTPGWTSTSGPFRNEIFITDVKTGFSKVLRRSDDLIDDYAVRLMRVSHFGSFLALTFEGRQPMEIWDLKSTRLLRRMAKTCPLIIDICWSNKHHSQNQLGGVSIEDKEIKADSGQQMVYRENLVILDNENRLYHVVVKGVHVRDGKQVNTQWLNNAIVTCMAWRGEILAFGYADGRISAWNLDAKQSKASSLNQIQYGPVESLRFSTGLGGGPGYLTLLAVHTDGFSMWNAVDVTCLRCFAAPSREQPYKILCADLLADDCYPVLLTSDYCLKIFDEKAADFMRPSSLSSLRASSITLPKTSMTLLKIVLLDASLRHTYHEQQSDEFMTFSSYIKQLDIAASDKALLNKFVDLNFEKESYLDEVTPLLALNLCHSVGDEWEVDFWTLFNACFINKDAVPAVPSKFDSFLDNVILKNIESLGTSAFDYRHCSRSQWTNHIRSLILLDEHEKAINLLLSGAGSKTSNATNNEQSSNYYFDCLKACVLSSDKSQHHVAVEETSKNSRSSVLKIAATNLIADGKLFEGIELLCVGGHTIDACRYLQSFGRWFDAYWLAKVALDQSDARFVEIVRKWVDALLSPQISRKTMALYLLMTIKDYDRILDVLLNWKQTRLAILLIYFLKLDDASQLNPNQVEKLNNNNNNTVCQRKIQNIYAQYSRLLFDIGLKTGATFYAQRAGDMSEALLKEFKILSLDHIT